MVEAVLAHALLGISVQAARRFMVCDGFGCSPQSNAEFLGREGLDYVYCNRSEGNPSLVSRRWQVAMVHQDCKFVEVLASTGLTGL